MNSEFEGGITEEAIEFLRNKMMGQLLMVSLYAESTPKDVRYFVQSLIEAGVKPETIAKGIEIYQKKIQEDKQ